MGIGPVRHPIRSPGPRRGRDENLLRHIVIWWQPVGEDTVGDAKLGLIASFKLREEEGKRAVNKQAIPDIHAPPITSQNIDQVVIEIAAIEID
jgi:hypothetical protein